MELVPAEYCTELQVLDYFNEWKNHREEMIPTSTDLGGLSFEDWKSKLAGSGKSKTGKRVYAPEDLYFLINDSDAIIGAINIKHRLTPYLKINGGNIAYGVRFSERNKGYGAYMLKKIVEIWFETKSTNIQLACFCDNIGSRRIIESCGGELIRRKNTKNGEKLIYSITRVRDKSRNGFD